MTNINTTAVRLKANACLNSDDALTREAGQLLAACCDEIDELREALGNVLALAAEPDSWLFVKGVDRARKVYEDAHAALKGGNPHAEPLGGHNVV